MPLEGSVANSPARRVVGALRILSGLLILVTIVAQIADQLTNGAFEPGNYFSYFTIQSSLIDVVVFAVGGVMALRMANDTILFTAIRASALSYALITGIVYNALLRGLPHEGYQGLTWPNEVLHVVAPILILLDWLLSPGRPRLRWVALRIAPIYPVAWAIYTFIRGGIIGFYPYPFIDPGTAGMGSAIVYVLVISIFIMALVALAIAYGRRFSRAPADT